MLYLIIPPIIIVLTLVALVYFFSHRFPEIEKEADAEALSGVKVQFAQRLGQTKRFFLYLMKGSFRLLKTVARGVYGLFISSGKYIQEKRTERQSKTLGLRAAKSLQQPDPSRALEQDFSQEADIPASDATSDNQHITSSRQQRMRQLRRSLPGLKREDAPRPMVSQNLTHPENPVSDTVSAKNQFEEILIERIAANPRDMEAYERLGDYYLEQDNLQDAKECYRQVLRLSPVHRLAKIKIRRLEKMLEKR